MNDLPVLRVVAKATIPLIMVFALYVQFHGEYGPGGGFQAGVIFASALILYTIVFGVDQAKRIIPVGVLRALACSGLFLYIGVGVASMWRGGQFLEYGALLGDPVDGQHLGILLIELGVGMTVSATMVLIYFAFARHIHD